MTALLISAVFLTQLSVSIRASEPFVTEPPAVFSQLEGKSLKDYFPKTLKLAPNAVEKSADPKEQKDFDQDYAKFVVAAGDVGWFGNEGEIDLILNRNAERERYLKWFRENETLIINPNQVKQFASETFMQVFVQTRDAFNYAEFTRTHDRHKYLARTLSFMGNTRVRETLDLANDAFTNPIVTAVGDGVVTVIAWTTAMQLTTAFFAKLTEAPIQFAGAKGAKTWSRPAVLFQKLLNGTIKKAEKQIISANKAVNVLSEIGGAIPGMTPDDVHKNWEKVKNRSILLNQVFSETPQQIGNGRGTIFLFSMDAHRTYSTSLATYALNLEQYTKGLDASVRALNDRFREESGIDVQKMRIAVAGEGTAEELRQKEKLAELKQVLSDQEIVRKNTVKQIVDGKYELEGISKRLPEYAIKQSEFESRAERLAAEAGLKKEELDRIVTLAGQIRLTQKQSATTVAEWIYFEFTHPEIRKMASRDADVGKTFLDEYKLIQEWMGYQDYLLANKEDLKLLLNHLKFFINLDLILPAQKILEATGKKPITRPLAKTPEENADLSDFIEEQAKRRNDRVESPIPLAKKSRLSCVVRKLSNKN